MTPTVAVVGAECSGKSTLCSDLRGTLGGTLVPEYLRTFVNEHQRVPRREEQAGVMAGQISHEVQAIAGGPDWVWSDSGALMTAIYSLMYYDDSSLLAPALDHHRKYAATIWCDIDVPWMPDDGQRDGPDFRQRGHELISDALGGADFPVIKVSGPADSRLIQVVTALA